MHPVFQTRFGGPEKPDAEQGNCFAACLASILERPIEDVDVPFDGKAVWLPAFQNRLNALGLNLTIVLLPPELWKSLGGAYYIAAGKSPRGDWLHAVVYRNNKLAHDPVKDGRGLAGPVEDLTVLVWNAKGKGRSANMSGSIPTTIYLPVTKRICTIETKQFQMALRGGQMTSDIRTFVGDNE